MIYGYEYVKKVDACAFFFSYVTCNSHLRQDSAAQIHPLLVPFFNGTALIQQDPRLDRIVSGLILRTARYIRHDPYANAFRIDDTNVFSAAQKAMGRHDLISTWNYELDSACYYMRMIYFYWKQAPSPERVLKRPAVQQAVEIMVDLWIAEQRHEEDAYPTGDLFDCVNCNKPYRYPGLPREGKGAPTNASSGLIWTGTCFSFVRKIKRCDMDQALTLLLV
jgi:hypothetical protein